jgi:HEAT repeat protein
MRLTTRTIPRLVFLTALLLVILVLVLGWTPLKEEAIDYWLIYQLDAKDEETRKRAAESLGERGTTRAFSPLLEIAVLEDNEHSDDVKAVAWDSVKDIARKRNRIVPSRVKYLKGNTKTRLAALDLLALCHRAPEGTLPALLDALQDSEAVVRGTAAMILGKFRFARPRVVDALVEAIADRKEEVRVESARALGRLGAAARPSLLALIEAFRKGSPILRWSSAEALLTIQAAGTPADSGTAEFRERLISLLAKMLSAGNPDTQSEAALVLARLRAGAGRALPELIDALDEHDPRVRAMAAMACGGLAAPGRDVLSALLVLLSDETEEVRRQAAKSLVRILRQSPEPDGERWRSAMAEALKDTDDQVRFLAMAYFLHKDPPDARDRDLLVEALTDESPAVQWAAATGLAEMGKDAGLPPTEIQRIRRNTAIPPIKDESLATLELTHGFSVTTFYDGIPNPDGIASRSDGSLLVVNEGVPRGVFTARRGDSFDPTDAFSTTGRPFVSPDDIFLYPDGQVFVADGQARAVFRIAPEGGEPVPLVGGMITGRRNQPSIVDAYGLTIAPAAFRGPVVTPGDLIIANNGYGRSNYWGVWAVSPVSAQVGVIADGRVFSNGPIQVACGPDGRAFVYENSDAGTSRILEVSPHGRVKTFVPDIPDRGGLAIHPRTGDVYFGLQDRVREIWWVPSEGGAPQVFASGFTSRLQDLEFAADGRALFVSVRGKVIEITGPFDPER